MTNKKYNILVLDDERFILVTVKACLRGENFNVVTVDNVQDALYEFKQGSFDLIITDILMSSIDGFKFRDLIRGYNKRIPIIFLTSLLDDIDNSLLSRITQDQYSYYLNKTFTKKTLLEIIRLALANYKSVDDVTVLQRSIDEDLTLASQVQRMMLPNWCLVSKAYSACYLYEPMYKVSGDLFEWLELDNDRCLGVIGDVAGHGIHAALRMAPIQTLIKRLGFERAASEVQVHEILTELNEFLCTQFGSKSYMTCLVAIWDFQSNHLVYQTAGHPGIICLDTETAEIRNVNPEERGNLPLGISSRTKYTAADNIEVDFSDETVFIAYTDGLLDIGSKSNPEDFLGKESLLPLISSLSKTTNVISIPYRIRNAIEQIGFDCPSDDIFLFAIKKNNYYGGTVLLRYIQAEFLSIENAVAETAELLAEMTGNQDWSARVEILLSEFLTNIVKHGLDKTQSQRKDIVLRVKVVPGRIYVNVIDHGRFWDYQEGLSGKDADTILNELNEQRNMSGRGLPIILRIAETITREHFWGLNETTFMIPEKQPEIKKNEGKGL
ncbi:MAG: SpoIIE family protein phosphatase [Lentisphaerae bacterium]|jgi:serine phosphatase RsbU (regulator of sigma subunit)/anti-sigma regulatory factor (Ser/Thr protein kinase)|nr:SpoIIE family protein phosphatase [Lentisphaerota bacterium]